MTTITINRATVEQVLEALRCGVPTGKITLYAWDKAISDLNAALAQQAEPVQEFASIPGTNVRVRLPAQERVATVTECEACFTPDVCQLRGTCDYYAASQMRIAAAPQPPAEPVQEPDYWQEEARRYAGNADYWRKRYEALAEPAQKPVTKLLPRKLPEDNDE